MVMFLGFTFQWQSNSIDWPPQRKLTAFANRQKFRFLDGDG